MKHGNKVFFPNRLSVKLSLRVSEASEVPIHSHIWVDSTTFKQL